MTKQQNNLWKTFQTAGAGVVDKATEKSLGIWEVIGYESYQKSLWIEVMNPVKNHKNKGSYKLPLFFYIFLILYFMKIIY